MKKAFKLMVIILMFILTAGEDSKDKLSYVGCHVEYADQYENVFFTIGTILHLNCTLPTLSSNCSRNSKTTWLINDTKLIESSRLRISRNNNTVYVTYGTANDVGRYVCRIDYNGRIFKKTFNLVVTDPTPMQKVLLPNMIPMNETDEKRGNAYWLPQMLNRDHNQHYVANPGSNIKLVATFYIALKNVTKTNMKATWYYLTKDSEELDMESDDKAEIIIRKSKCKNWFFRFNVRPLSGSCFSTKLDITNVTVDYEGDYRLVIKVSDSGKTHFLNLTYSLSINWTPPDCSLQFANESETVLFAIGTPFNLSCTPSSEMKYCPNLSNRMLWFVNNTELVEGSRVRIDRTSKSVLVTDGTANDVGEYVCQIDDNNGTILKRTFNVIVTDPTPLQKVLLPNVLPPNETDEKKGNIYWLPKILHRDYRPNRLEYETFPGRNIRLTSSFYIALENVDRKMSITWYYLRNGSEDVDLKSDDKSKIIIRKYSCSDRFVIKPLNGSCFKTILEIENPNAAYDGNYRMSVSVSDSGKTHLLNFTYPVRINSTRLYRDELWRSVQMNFNKDAKVCLDSSIEFLCTFKPHRNYITEITKRRFFFKKDKKDNVLATTDESSPKFDKDDVSRNVLDVAHFNLKHTKRIVAPSDAGKYFCISRPPEKLTYVEYMGFVVWHRMDLTVTECIGNKKDFWITLLAVIVFVMITLLIVSRLYYSNTYLIKTVFIKPNKDYLPYDNSQFVLPDVSIKTVRRLNTNLANCISRRKHLTKHSVSFHEMSSQMGNYCTFSSNNVDVSGLSPDCKVVLNDRRNNGIFQAVIKSRNETRYSLPSDSFWTFARDDLTMGSKIGEGAFGIVYNGFVENGGSTPLEVAVKTLQDNFDDEAVVNLVREFEMMKRIGKHPNIVSLYGACFDDERLYVIMELAKHGNLKNFLRASRRRHDITEGCVSSSDLFIPSIQQKDMIKISLQIAKGMEFLASKMIIHRDLAARNILVDHKLDMKISDFGLTRHVANYYRKTTDGLLPLMWMAPESLAEQLYSEKSDVWSFGILLWEIFTFGETPYPTIPASSLLQNLRDGLHNDKPEFANDDMYKMMLRTWEFKPEDRPKFAELVENLSRTQSTVEEVNLDDIPNAPQSMDAKNNLSDNAITCRDDD